MWNSALFGSFLITTLDLPWRPQSTVFSHQREVVVPQDHWGKINFTRWKQFSRLILTLETSDDVVHLR